MSSPPPLEFLHPFQPTRFLPVLADRWVKVPPRIRFVGGASLHPALVSFLLGERRKESANGAQGRGGGWTIVRRRRNEIPRPLSPYRLEKDVEETFAYIDRQFSARTNPRAAFRLPFTAVGKSKCLSRLTSPLPNRCSFIRTCPTIVLRSEYVSGGFFSPSPPRGTRFKLFSGVRFFEWNLKLIFRIFRSIRGNRCY